MTTQTRSTRSLTALQVMDIVLALGCIGYGGCITAEMLDQRNYLHNSWPIAAAVLFVLVIAGCLVAQTMFFQLCGQLKHGRIFTEANDKALGIVAAACGVNTALLIGAGAADAIGRATAIALESAGANSFFSKLMNALEYGDPITYGAMAFLMAAVALIAWILQLLLRRAVELQQENDETV